MLFTKTSIVAVRVDAYGRLSDLERHFKVINFDLPTHLQGKGLVLYEKTGVERLYFNLLVFICVHL